jgi:very-short-patch-repair endonuclease
MKNKPQKNQSYYQKNKDKILAQQNFEVFIIWETDYNNDKQGIIQKCLTFLMQ